MAKSLVKKTKGTALVSMAELDRAAALDLREATKAVVSAEPLAGAVNIIRVKNRKFYIGETAIDSPLEVVVLASAAGQFFYEEAYDPEVKASPVCYALAPTESELVPDNNAPKKQHDGPCATCPHNQPGSGERGGFTRACTLRRRLAVLMISDKSDEPQWASLELSVTAIRGWSQYVKGLGGIHNLPYYYFVTALDFEDAKKGDYWHIAPRLVDKLSAIRPDWLQPEKGVKVGSAGWFNTTFIGKKVKEINESRVLLTPPTRMADEPTKGKKARVPVGQVKGKGKGKKKGARRG